MARDADARADIKRLRKVVDRLNRHICAVEELIGRRVWVGDPELGHENVIYTVAPCATCGHKHEERVEEEPTPLSWATLGPDVVLWVAEELTHACIEGLGWRCLVRDLRAFAEGRGEAPE